MHMGQGKYALSIRGCSTQREKRTDCFLCDEYGSCKGKKRLAPGVFIALALPAHLPSGSRQRLSRKAGKEPVKCRVQDTKPPGNPAKSVSKRPFRSSACEVVFGFGGKSNGELLSFHAGFL